jgi:hypothetical protein
MCSGIPVIVEVGRPGTGAIRVNVSAGSIFRDGNRRVLDSSEETNKSALVHLAKQDQPEAGLVRLIFLTVPTARSRHLVRWRGGIIGTRLSRPSYTWNVPRTLGAGQRVYKSSSMNLRPVFVQL